MNRDCIYGFMINIDKELSKCRFKILAINKNIEILKVKDMSYENLILNYKDSGIIINKDLSIIENYNKLRKNDAMDRFSKELFICIKKYDKLSKTMNRLIKKFNKLSK